MTAALTIDQAGVDSSEDSVCLAHCGIHQNMGHSTPFNHAISHYIHGIEICNVCLYETSSRFHLRGLRA